MSDVPKQDLKPGGNELFHWAGELGVTQRALRAARTSPQADISHPAMDVNLDACIQCTRCVRACREEQVNDVIGYAFRGHDSKIVFDFDDPDGRVDVRGLRRVRAGVPDGRARARRRTPTRSSPTRRSTRSARTAASAASSPTT